MNIEWKQKSTILANLETLVYGYKLFRNGAFVPIGGNMKAQRIVSTTFCLVMVSLCAFAIFTATVMAQDDGDTAKEPPLVDFKAVVGFIIEGIIFSIVGLVVLMVGYKVFDMATPYDLNKQIAEENNVAAGIAVAGVLVSLGIIVAAAMG